MFRIRLGFLLLMLLPLGLQGCGDSSIEDDYFEYLTRLARVLDVPTEDWEQLAIRRAGPLYPSPKGRVLATSDTRLNLFKFLALRQCGLLYRVSERNSSLGKVMSSTARGVYESYLVAGIQRCIDTLQAKDELSENDAELLEELLIIKAVKQAELPLHQWNALWGSQVFQNYYSLSQARLQRHEVTGFEHPSVVGLKKYLVAYDQLVHISDKQLADQGLFEVTAGFETQMQSLEYHYGGRLIVSLYYAAAAINEATRLLNARLENKPLCFNGKPSRDAEILQNVFTKFYVLSLQPYISRLDQEAVSMMQLSQQAWRPFGALATQNVNEFYRFYLAPDSSAGPLPRMRVAMKSHAKQWNQLLRSCGLKVGGVH